MSAVEQGGLLSPSDIAELAGVTRSAVSNWRKRADDFPTAVAGTSAKPLYSQSDVMAWLSSRGHKAKKVAAESRVWAVMNQLRGVMPAEQASDLLLALLIERKTGTKQRLDRSDVDRKVLEQIQGALAGVDPSELGEVGDYVLERLARAAGRSGGQAGFIGSRVSTLLANLAAARSGEVLYDPACGIGTALIQAVELGAPSKRVVGHDIDPESLRVTRQRAELRNVPLELVETDVLREDIDPQLAADVIILEPPFGLRNTSVSLADPRFEYGIPPASSADTAWLQHVVAHLSSSGRGYVLTPVGTLTNRREADVRSEMLRRGCVEAIVALPGKMLPQTSIPMALWVLRRPVKTGADTILLIDGSQEEAPETEVVSWLEGATAAVPQAVVPVIDVIATEAVLSPQRWIGQTRPEGLDVATSYSDGWASIHETLNRLQTRVTDYPGTPELPKSRLVTVRDLIGQGVLSLSVGRPKQRYADAPAGLRNRLITPADLRKGLFQETGPAVEYDYPGLTRAGDVLVTSLHTVYAMIDPVGGHLPTTGVDCLRVLRPDVISPDYLAAVLVGNWNERFLKGNVIQRVDLRDLEVPLVSIAAQATVHELTSAWAALQVDAMSIANEAKSVSEALLQAVRYNEELHNKQGA